MSGLFGGSRKPRQPNNTQQMAAQSTVMQAQQSLTPTPGDGYQQLPNRLKRQPVTALAGGGSFGAGAGGRSSAATNNMLGATGKRNTFLGG